MGGVGVRFLGVEQHHCPLTAIKSLEELDWPPSSKSMVLPTACGIKNPYEKNLFLKAPKSMWLEEPANIAHISHHGHHRWWCIFSSQWWGGNTKILAYFSPCWPILPLFGVLFTGVNIAVLYKNWQMIFCQNIFWHFIVFQVTLL